MQISDSNMNIISLIHIQVSVLCEVLLFLKVLLPIINFGSTYV